MSKYFEITSKKLKDKVMDWVRHREEIREARYRFSRRVGGKRHSYITLTSVLGGEQFGILFAKMPDPKIWRWVEPNSPGPGYWKPRLASKVGKKLAEEMRALNVQSGELTRIIKMEVFSGFNARSPGMKQVGDRIFIITPDDYKPIRGIKRISDLTFERLTA